MPRRSRLRRQIDATESELLALFLRHHDVRRVLDLRASNAREHGVLTRRLATLDDEMRRCAYQLARLLHDEDMRRARATATDEAPRA